MKKAISILLAVGSIIGTVNLLKCNFRLEKGETRGVYVFTTDGNVWKTEEINDHETNAIVLFKTNGTLNKDDDEIVAIF